MVFKKGHKYYAGKKTGAKPKLRLKQLYGDYKGLTELQIEYIKIKADPETELKGLTKPDIAKILGIKSLKALYNWSVNPIIRDAIIAEKKRKSAEIYPSMLKSLEDLAFGRGTNTSNRLRAMKLWFDVGGYYNKSKEAEVDKMSEKDKSFEKRLMELANRSSKNTS